MSGTLPDRPGYPDRGKWTDNLLTLGARQYKELRKPWKAPRLKADGTDWRPSGIEPGSWVRFHHGGPHEGQVWSRCYRAGYWFVVTADRITYELHERELVAVGEPCEQSALGEEEVQKEIA